MQEVVKMMYILVEMDDTSSISSPLKTTNRIKFLSFAASEKFIVFGASSGGLYVYNRESFTFKSLVPSKEGPVTHVIISPNEKWFGFSTTRGVSCVLEHNGSSVNRRILSHVHEGRNVTALQWNNSSTQLYVGDNSGQISVISVSSYLTPAVALMQLDSSVVQLDTCSYMLLASTTTRSYLCDTFREQYRQIGSRLRDGEFGACFYHVDSFESYIDPQDYSSDLKDSHGPFSSISDGEWLLTENHLQNVKLFCARPGLRLWEVRIDGAVLSTHQYKQLRSTHATSVIQPPAVSLSVKKPEPSEHLLQFKKLFKVSSKFIVTYDSKGLCVINPLTSEVILWTDQFKNIVDMCVVGDVMYLWMGDTNLHAVSLTPIDKFLVRMYLQKKYSYCVQLCAAHVNILKKLAHVSLKMHILVDLLDKLEEEGKEKMSIDEEILSTTRDLLDEVSKNAQNHAQAQMLNSGIFIVGNAYLLSQEEGFRVDESQHLTSEKPYANGLVVEVTPNFWGKQDIQSDDSSKIQGDTLNSTFMKSILPSVSSLPLLSEQSNINTDEDFDPFPDLPLSSLTSTETIMALKSLTSSVSGTITNSTKSLKERWQSFEEKLRGQEESGLSVEKSINQCHIESKNLFESSNDEEKVMVIESRKKKPLKLEVGPFMAKCAQIARQQVDCGELELEMLNSLASLYEEFRQSSGSELEKFESNSEGLELSRAKDHRGFEKWLKYHDIVPFPFNDHFEKEFVSNLRWMFQSCLKSGSVVKWVSQFISCTKVDYALFPLHIRHIHSKESLLVDQAVGCTLEICKYLLDPHTALQCLDESGSSCQFFSWNVIMDYLHSSSILTRDLTESESHTWPLPRVLNAMLVMLQLGQVESCRSIGEHVPMRHVLRTVLRLREDSAKIYSLFLLYLEKVPVQDLQSVLKDCEVFYFSRLAYEHLHKSDSGDQCVCGYPLNGIKYQRTFNRIGQTLLSHIDQTAGLSEAMSFCQRTGVLWYHLLVLRREEPIEEVLPLILQTACEEELHKRSSELSPSMWDLVFRLRARQQQGHCLQCGAQQSKGLPSSTIPWTSLACLLLTQTDVQFALELISKYSHLIPPGRVSQQFYQNCLLASAAESQNADLKRILLETLTDSKAVPVMSPQLAGRLSIPHGQGGHHWGMQLQLSETCCLYCQLPLASSTASAVTTFKCRHSFHSVCLQQQPFKQCPICIK